MRLGQVGLLPIELMCILNNSPVRENVFLSSIEFSSGKMPTQPETKKKQENV